MEELTNDQCRLTIKLLEMLENTGYELVQEHGQRHLTAPEIHREGRKREKGAEVFVGRLPRDCYEIELMPILAKVGRLMELRLMLDFSGSTRGYAFALYENPRIAKKACIELDGYEIRPGHRIGVVKSIDNCRLFFGGVPKDKTKAEFMEELTKFLDGIVDIHVYPNVQNKKLNRGFIFVEFKDHRTAAMARKKLIPGKLILWKHEIAVDWADPEPGDPVDDETMQTVTSLFVRNLSLSITRQELKNIFQKSTQVPILKVKKIHHFAFFHYVSRAAAERVMEIMSQPNSILEQEGWEISWAKPICASKLLERQRLREAALTELYEENIPEHTAHVIALQNIAAEKLGATCSFQCWQLPCSPSFVCKITIFKNGITLFTHQGEVLPTKYKAISATSLNVYHYLSNFLNNLDCGIYQNMIQTYMQSNTGIDMMQDVPYFGPNGQMHNHFYNGTI